MKIIQWISNLNYGDAIGNEVVTIHQLLLANGYETAIMAFETHPKLAHLTERIDDSKIQKEDVVIIHKASGDHLTEKSISLSCRKILLYHNITPGHFFAPYDLVMAWNQRRGRKQLAKLLGHVDYAWADSSYNAKELIQLGMDNAKVSVLPFLLPVDDKAEAPCEELLKEMKETKGRKILFVGRIAPNKKQEDVIKAFCYYQRYIDPDATLYLVGSYGGFERYYAQLQGFCAELNLKNVVFTGHVTDAQKLSYFQGADLFLCMSEHEGFCVPLLEAMKADIPVLAYDACAVPETLGNDKGLFQRKEYDHIARRMQELIQNQDARKECLAIQKKSLARFALPNTSQVFLQLLHQAIEGGCQNGKN